MKPPLWIAPGQWAFERTLQAYLPGFWVKSDCRVRAGTYAFGSAPSVGEAMAVLYAFRRAQALA